MASPPQSGASARSDRARPVVSTILSDGSILETVHRPEERRTRFCISTDGKWRFAADVVVNGERLVPYSPANNLLTNGVVLLPSGPAPYDSVATLVAEIQAFIHRYVDVSPLFEEVAAYYVLLSWVYDAFNELPYLRLRGDPGSGKTRFLLTVGSLCYKPTFASGASTVSPIFRILDIFRGTLIVDEGDFRFSDERAEIVKILNNGNARGFPVLRSEAVGRREYDPRAYAVFGPKLVATRGYFEDRALESRCLTEELGLGRLRDDVPINLPATCQTEALAIRNQLLTFRFRTWGRHLPSEHLVDRTIEPRLAQIFVPLLAVIEDSQAREHLRDLARRYHRDLASERGMDMEAQLVEVIRDLIASGAERLSVKEIASWFADRHQDDYDRKVTPKWIGTAIRRKLRLRPERSRDGFVLPVSDLPAIKRLLERFGLAEDPGTEVAGVKPTTDSEPVAGSIAPT